MSDSYFIDRLFNLSLEDKICIFCNEITETEYDICSFCRMLYPYATKQIITETKIEEIEELLIFPYELLSLIFQYTYTIKQKENKNLTNYHQGFKELNLK